jgi:type IV secretory pathway VirB9-like protein
LKGAANINIVDTKGNIVFTKPIEVNSGINMYVIQELLSPGIYYIHIDNGAMRTQVVKHSIR